jgi:hypothetical protein
VRCAFSSALLIVYQRIVDTLTIFIFIYLFIEAHMGISLVGVPKKVVPLSKSAHVSVSSEFILQIKLILSSPNVVLTPKVLGVFFIKTASKQPLFKARWILQTWGLF